MRKVCYISGTRADFGLMRQTLKVIDAEPELELSILVTGMHLLPEYGETWREITTSGLDIGAKVAVCLSGNSGAEMSVAMGEQVIGFTHALQQLAPDLVIVLGDRGEMLAAAIVCLHLNIHVVHIHGGELSGTIDESMRHAVSKLAHYHFTSTENSRARLIRMGEVSDHIFVTGAPGLDEICSMKILDKAPLFERYGLRPELQTLLVIYHPVVQQADSAASQCRILMEALVTMGLQSLIIMPNADAGGAEISRVINDYKSLDTINVALHVARAEYLSLIAHVEVMVGNSSSGIIEAASLGTPAVNIGDRQNCRERNANVVDAKMDQQAIVAAISTAKSMEGQRWSNIYGDGTASDKITDLLKTISLDAGVLEKVNAY